MKFNVHRWNGKTWNFIAAVVAENEQEAARIIAADLGLRGMFASYPHIDTYDGQATSNTQYTRIGEAS